jgi:hypothetical protein
MESIEDVNVSNMPAFFIKKLLNPYDALSKCFDNLRESVSKSNLTSIKQVCLQYNSASVNVANQAPFQCRRFSIDRHNLDPG